MTICHHSHPQIKDYLTDAKTDCSAKDRMFFASFAFCVITFEPIMIQTCSESQNDCLNFSFVKDLKVVVEKMTRNCRKMIGKTADSLLCPLHSIQFSPLEFLPLRSYHALVHNFMGFFAPDAEKRPDLTIEVCICCLIV